MDVAVQAEHRVKANEKKDKYLDIELKKLLKMNVTLIPIVIGALGTTLKGMMNGAGRVGNWSTSRDHSNYNIVKIGYNTEKCPGDLRKLAIT